MRITFSEFIKILLRGSGQVMFQNNAHTGFLFLVGIFLAAPAIGVGSSIGLMAGTLAGLYFDRESFHKGWYGYNGMLTGAAMGAFIFPFSIMWMFATVGGVLSTLFLVFMTKYLKNLPPLTFPFIFISWILFILGKPYHGADLGPMLVSINLFDLPDFFTATFQSVSQVFLIGHYITGMIFLIALWASSFPAMLFAFSGGAVTSLLVLLIRFNMSDARTGLFGFSAVLTAIALGSVFRKPSLLSTGYALTGIIITFFIHLVMTKIFSLWGIPVFTAPFVFTIWIFQLLPKINRANLLR